jgi:RNA ligase
MFYEFPVGLTLDEVRHVISTHNARCGTTAFIEADRGDHVIFNYVVAFEGSFPQPTGEDPETDRHYAILRECRGLIMCKREGVPLARRFHKFFNVNEKAFTQAELVDWSQPHVILEKLDGSMITPFFSEGRMRWGTKMGATEVALPVESFVAAYDANITHPLRGYAAIAEVCRSSGTTPLFEWCSRRQKIVIDYEEEQLVLIGVRSNETGSYMPYDTMVSFAELHGVPVVKALPGSVENIKSFMAEARDLEGVEGYIIRFANGHMLKVKGEWYCAIHRTKDMLQFEKDVWQLILDERMDDAMAFMDVDDRDRVSRFMDEFSRRVSEVAKRLVATVEASRILTEGDKKMFATKVVTEQTVMERPLLYAIWDGKDPEEVVRDHLKRHATTNTKLAQVRPLLGGLTWGWGDFA